MKSKASLLVLLVASLAVLASCEDDFEQPVLPPPLFVRFTTPADSAQLDNNDPVNLSITFNRTMTLDEISLEIFPDPLEPGTIKTTGTGRNVTVFGLVTDPTRRVQRLLLDGVYMTEPYTMFWYTGTPIPVASFSGVVASQDTSKVKPLGAVVFALDGEAPFNPIDPGTFNDIKAEAITVVQVLDTREQGPYAIGQLDTNTRYLVVAVADTDGDTVYDPLRDWWGYYGEGPEHNPEVVVAAIDPLAINTDVDITLRPPR
jgi:hypothetical protein